MKLNRVCLSININLECVKNGKKLLMFLQKKDLQLEKYNIYLQYHLTMQQMYGQYTNSMIIVFLSKLN